LKPANELTGEGEERGRTADREQADIGGNKSGLAPGLDEKGERLGPDHGNRRLRAVNLAVGEQGDGALVAWLRRVGMEQEMQAGENDHGLKEEEDSEPQGRVAPPRLP
jgi:hypothetical protein